MLDSLKSISKVTVSALILGNVPICADIYKNVDTALQKLRQGDARSGWASWKKAEDEIWNRMPLTINMATFTQTPARGWGMYDPRNNLFKAGETMHIYMEPIAYRYSVSGTDPNLFYHIRLQVGLTLSTEEGEELFSTNSFGMLDVVSRHPNRELFVSLDIQIPEAVRAGNYKLTLRLSDLIGRQNKTVTLPFIVTK